MCSQVAKSLGALLHLSSLADSNSPPLLGSESSLGICVGTAAKWSGCTKQFFSRSAQTSETAGALFACVCVSKQVFWSTVLSVKCCQSRVASLLFAYSWQSCSDSELQLKKERGNQPSGYQSLKASKFKAKTPDDSHRLVGPLSNEWLAFACPPWGVVSSVAVCLSNLASCYSPHLFQRLSKRAVRHQSTSEWSGCTNQFSQDRHRRLRRLGHS